MKNRFIPFGYMVQNGITQVHPTESRIVKRIFMEYLNGNTLKAIAEKLENNHVEYLPEKSDWNKNRVKRIIEDRRYLGTDTYQKIIDEDIQQQAIAVKDNRNSQNTLQTKAEYRLPIDRIICSVCGHPLTHRTDNRYKNAETWKCVNPECNMVMKVSTAQLLQEITKILNSLIDNPNLIQHDENEPSAPSLEVRRLTNEINRALERSDFDKEQLKKLIFQCAAEKYNGIKDARHSSDILKNDFAKQNRSSTFNIDLFERTVTHIQLGKNGLHLQLKNNQVVGKEYESI